MIKILHILSSLDGGGVESMITNYYYNFKGNNIKFDFAVHNPKIGILEEKLTNGGSVIYHVTPKKKNFLKNLKELFYIIDRSKYDAVYCHQNYISWIPLLIAKIKGIKIRIVHSPGCNPPTKIFKKILNRVERFLINMFATNYFACGIEASKWLYGQKWKEKYPKRLIINNAIDIEKFSFDKKTRDSLRKKYQIGDKICIFHAGRFSAEKNHKFILDIVSKLDPEKYCLFLAGNGELYDETVEYCKNLNLKNVTFLGIRKDVNNLYLMADVFLLPSFHEGFPVTLVEAQASSLKCIASANVSTETKLLDKTVFLPLFETEKWIKEIENINISNRQTEEKILTKNGFNIKVEAKKFYELLSKICQ